MNNKFMQPLEGIVFIRRDDKLAGEQDWLKVAGGPGSGNFGHGGGAGGPGNPGGSTGKAPSWKPEVGYKPIATSKTKDGATFYVYAGSGDTAGVYVARSGDKEIARIIVRKAGEGNSVSQTQMEDEWRRRGVGTVMYDAIEDHLGRKLEPSETQTPAAKAFWEKRRGQPRTASRKLRFTFNRTSPAVTTWAAEHAADLVTQVLETTRKKIRKAIVDHTLSGDWDAAVEAIEDAIGDEARAARIARHETHQAASEGQRLAWEQAVNEGYLPADARRTWIAVGDGRTCPICSELDGTVADLQGMYDGNYAGPPAHVACRCTEGIV